MDHDEIRMIHNRAVELAEELDVPVTTDHELPVIGREVGDDRIDFCHATYPLLMGLASQELVFLMKTSKEDTFISRRIWNFCENTQSFPSGTNENFDYARS
jgi:hypothetical protein